MFEVERLVSILMWIWILGKNDEHQSKGNGDYGVKEQVKGLNRAAEQGFPMESWKYTYYSSTPNLRLANCTR